MSKIKSIIVVPTSEWREKLIGKGPCDSLPPKVFSGYMCGYPEHRAWLPRSQFELRECYMCTHPKWGLPLFWNGKSAGTDATSRATACLAEIDELPGGQPQFELDPDEAKIRTDDSWVAYYVWNSDDYDYRMQHLGNQFAGVKIVHYYPSLSQFEKEDKEIKWFLMLADILHTRDIAKEIVVEYESEDTEDEPAASEHE